MVQNIVRKGSGQKKRGEQFNSASACCQSILARRQSVSERHPD